MWSALRSGLGGRWVCEPAFGALEAAQTAYRPMAMTMFADGTVVIVEREMGRFDGMERALGQVQGKRLLGAVIV